MGNLTFGSGLGGRICRTDREYEGNCICLIFFESSFHYLGFMGISLSGCQPRIGDETKLAQAPGSYSASRMSEDVFQVEKGIWESNLVGTLPLLSMSGTETRCFI